MGEHSNVIFLGVPHFYSVHEGVKVKLNSVNLTEFRSLSLGNRGKYNKIGDPVIFPKKNIKKSYIFQYSKKFLHHPLT